MNYNHNFNSKNPQFITLILIYSWGPSAIFTQMPITSTTVITVDFDFVVLRAMTIPWVTTIPIIMYSNLTLFQVKKKLEHERSRRLEAEKNLRDVQNDIRVCIYFDIAPTEITLRIPLWHICLALEVCVIIWKSFYLHHHFRMWIHLRKRSTSCKKRTQLWFGSYRSFPLTRVTIQSSSAVKKEFLTWHHVNDTPKYPAVCMAYNRMRSNVSR